MTPNSLFTSFLALLIASTTAVDQTVNPGLNAKLKTEATEIDKHNNDLNTDDAWIFDFNERPNYTFKPGSVVNANAATFPTLTGFGMTMAMLNLGPCAMLPPHMHSRATNLVVAISGSTSTYMYRENGVKLVKADLTPGKMTIFPQGSLHTMQNNGCDNAVLVSALNSEDTGTTNILNGALRNFPEDLMKAAFGDASLDIAKLGKNIPEVGTGSVLGSAECMQKCKMTVGRSYKRGYKFVT
ncbi:RmlC-like cupin [Lindgomyces ingoldianus]|uniref:RmlC-like cupin n=1 Tax=Lindgomyces ingoldianus TaxID=673940 RepID=A0ACB6RHL1_9PLEO|nr:RmlC-like cupin [Lindgomyces ingoldianus]KAF2477802.1 RmlC-like cupin [Lindgomyces ingoldianus]